MSVPRLLLVPMRKTSMAYAVASVLAEAAVQAGQDVRLHHLGVLCPAQVWDRWGGSSFLDPGLYGLDTARELYARSVSRASLSLLAAECGPFDEEPSGGWTPAGVAEALDAPMLLLLDCQGWGKTLTCLVEGVRSRLGQVDLAGLILCGLRDVEHWSALREELSRPELPVVGGFFEDDVLHWESAAPGVSQAPPRGSLAAEVSLVEQRIDLDLLERLAVRRGFLPDEGRVHSGRGPLIGVASGQGFTLWSRDSLDLLRSAGARLTRVDLLEDTSLPEELAGLILAGHLWEEVLPDLAHNSRLMREIRVRVNEGMPLVALGGGMTYLLDTVQDTRGCSHRLVGLLPASAEIVGQMEEPSFLELRAEKGSCLLTLGQTLKGWIAEDVELIRAPASWDFALSIGNKGDGGRLGEGVAGPRLFCSRVLFHFACCKEALRGLVGQCASYAAEREKVSGADTASGC